MMFVQLPCASLKTMWMIFEVFTLLYSNIFIVGTCVAYFVYSIGTYISQATFSVHVLIFFKLAVGEAFQT